MITATGFSRSVIARTRMQPTARPAQIEASRPEPEAPSAKPAGYKKDLYKPEEEQPPQSEAARTSEEADVQEAMKGVKKASKNLNSAMKRLASAQTSAFEEIARDAEEEETGALKAADYPSPLYY